MKSLFESAAGVSLIVIFFLGGFPVEKFSWLSHAGAVVLTDGIGCCP